MVDSQDDLKTSNRTLKTLIYNSSLRSWVIQVFAVVVTLGVAYFLISNIAANLRQVELPFGFSFIESTAGFNVS